MSSTQLGEATFAETSNRTDLGVLFAPSSIAVVGASTREGSLSNRLVLRLAAGSFDGQVFPINPTAQTVGPYAAFPDVQSLAVLPDVILMMRPMKHALAELDAAVALGVPFVVLFNALSGEYEKFNDSVRAAIAGSATRVLGPNSMGIQNYARDTSMTFSAPPLGFAAEPQHRGTGAPKPGIAVIGHSGGASQSICAEIAAMGALVTQMVSLGNESDLRAADFLEHFTADETVDVVVAYLEQIRDARRFLAAARELTRAGKRLVVLRAGSSDAARLLAASHTGAIVGSLGHERVFLREAGVYLAESTREAGQIASVFSFAAGRRPSGNGLGVITISGGLSGVIADLASRSGVELPTLESDVAERINRTLSASELTDAQVLNPLDLGAAGLHDEEFLLETVRLVLGQNDIGAGLLLVSEFMAERSARAVAIAEELGKTLALFVFKKDLEPFHDLMASGVPAFGAEDDAIRALGALLQPRDDGPLDSPLDDDVAALDPPTDFSEHGVKAWLAEEGVSVPNGLVLSGATIDALDPRDLHTELETLSPPMVLKVSAPGLLHKSEVGGVRLGIGSSAEAVEATAEMCRALAGNSIVPEGFIFEEQIATSLPEWLLGVSNDPDFGPIVTFGLGGVAVEALGHVVSASAPLTVSEARKLVESLPAWSKLVDRRMITQDTMRQMAELVSTVSSVAWRSRSWLAEMDLNPVVIDRDGSPTALDAAVQITGEIAEKVGLP